ncbi:MAG: imidazole glycerol phosphate synthase subunit HisH [Nitrospirota bacterium]
MIAIIDYGMGNLRSVEKGFLKMGIDARIVSDTGSIDDARGIVLPGVGAFRDCIKNLTEARLTDAIIRSVKKGKPFLGICLGLQMLFSESEEFGRCRGLDLFKGKVVRFPESGLKVPHMGWNNVRILKRPPIFDNIADEGFFYFVHSFYVVAEDKGIIAGTTDYGLTFTSMIWDENVFATQFHPEKSQALGLKVLKGFGDFAAKA